MTDVQPGHGLIVGILFDNGVDLVVTEPAIVS